MTSGNHIFDKKEAIEYSIDSPVCSGRPITLPVHREEVFGMVNQGCKVAVIMSWVECSCLPLMIHFEYRSSLEVHSPGNQSAIW